MTIPFTDEPGIYDVREYVYHNDPCPEPSLSAGVAKTLLDLSPAHAALRHPRLTGEPYTPDTKMNIGAAAHQVVLEETWDRIVVCDFADWKKKDARAMRDAAFNEWKTPILLRHVDVVEAMALSLKSSGYLLNTSKGALNEQSAFWQEDDVWVRTRPDQFEVREKYIEIRDLKTTQIKATPRHWGRRQIWEYSMQHGLYRRGMSTLFPGLEIRFRFVVQETEPPYGVGMFDFDDAGYDYADINAIRAIDLWRTCMETYPPDGGEPWPSYPKGLNTVESPYWIREAVEAPEDLR